MSKSIIELHRTFDMDAKFLRNIRPVNQPELLSGDVINPANVIHVDTLLVVDKPTNLIFEQNINHNIFLVNFSNDMIFVSHTIQNDSNVELEPNQLNTRPKNIYIFADTFQTTQQENQSTSYVRKIFPGIIENKQKSFIRIVKTNETINGLKVVKVVTEESTKKPRFINNIVLDRVSKPSNNSQFQIVSGTHPVTEDKKTVVIKKVRNIPILKRNSVLKKQSEPSSNESTNFALKIASGNTSVLKKIQPKPPRFQIVKITRPQKSVGTENLPTSTINSVLKEKGPLTYQSKNSKVEIIEANHVEKLINKPLQKNKTNKIVIRKNNNVKTKNQFKLHDACTETKENRCPQQKVQSPLEKMIKDPKFLKDLENFVESQLVKLYDLEIEEYVQLEKNKSRNYFKPDDPRIKEYFPNMQAAEEILPVSDECPFFPNTLQDENPKKPQPKLILLEDLIGKDISWMKNGPNITVTRHQRREEIIKPKKNPKRSVDKSTTLINYLPGPSKKDNVEPKKKKRKVLGNISRYSKQNVIVEKRPKLDISYLNSQPDAFPDYFSAKDHISGPSTKDNGEPQKKKIKVLQNFTKPGQKLPKLDIPYLSSQPDEVPDYLSVQDYIPGPSTKDNREPQKKKIKVLQNFTISGHGKQNNKTVIVGKLPKLDIPYLNSQPDEVPDYFSVKDYIPGPSTKNNGEPQKKKIKVLQKFTISGQSKQNDKKVIVEKLPNLDIPYQSSQPDLVPDYLSVQDYIPGPSTKNNGEPQKKKIKVLQNFTLSGQSKQNDKKVNVEKMPKLDIPYLSSQPDKVPDYFSVKDYIPGPSTKNNGEPQKKKIKVLQKFTISGQSKQNDKKVIVEKLPNLDIPYLSSQPDEVPDYLSVQDYIPGPSTKDNGEPQKKKIKVLQNFTISGHGKQNDKKVIVGKLPKLDIPYLNSQPDEVPDYFSVKDYIPGPSTKNNGEPQKKKIKVLQKFTISGQSKQNDKKVIVEKLPNLDIPYLSSQPDEVPDYLSVQDYIPGPSTKDNGEPQKMKIKFLQNFNLPGQSKQNEKKVIVEKMPMLDMPYLSAGPEEVFDYFSVEGHNMTVRTHQKSEEKITTPERLVEKANPLITFWSSYRFNEDEMDLEEELN